MPRKGMKLEQALKLYIGLYVLCFCLTWLVSVPMLVHVTPQSECLLFVTPYIRYGDPIACNFVGIAPLFVAVATVVLIVLHGIQLKSLKQFLRKPGPHSSNHHHRPTHIFWRMVVFHGCVTLVVLTITAIVTAGYVATCQNLYRDVSNTVRKRVEPTKFGGVDSRTEQHDKFADDLSINRYSNNFRDSWGQSSFEHGITCRNILTDPENHSRLKINHGDNPRYKQFYGFWYGNDIADVGNIRYYTYRNNLVLEMAMAGCWISFALWLTIFILMVKERHHIKAHLTDESMWGSEFGGASRRSAGSRLSNQSFDKMSASRYSSQSGSRYNAPRHNPEPMIPPPSYNAPTPLATSQPTQVIQGGTNNSLLAYFSQDPQQVEEAVDVDAAIGEPIMEDCIQDSRMCNGDVSGVQQEQQDTSFDLPIEFDQSDGLDYGPIPLGDEVSQGVIKQVPIVQQPMAPPQMHQMSPVHNPNRVTGRRGGRRGVGSSPNGFPHPTSSTTPVGPNVTTEYKEHRVERQRVSYDGPSRQSSSGYRTQLGNQSMI